MRKARCWFLYSGFLNCSRTIRYLRAISKAPSAMPSAWAAMPMRPPSRVFSAAAKPMPGGVIMLATGTCTSLKCSSLTMALRMPMVLWRSPMEKPGVLRSTTKVAMLLGPASWSVRA